MSEERSQKQKSTCHMTSLSQIQEQAKWIVVTDAGGEADGKEYKGLFRGMEPPTSWRLESPVHA